MASESVRVELCFDGGQLIGALVTPATADELERVVGSSGGGAHTLDTDDGRVSVDLGRVVYVKRYARESRVGFGI